jgi:NNP family nitrate/nitrite transporter-like MFS transporter
VNSSTGKATRIDLFSLSTPQMRAFHMTWFAFFLCFFAWFGIAPLMPIVRTELALTKDQVGWCIIGSVSITVLARLLFGWLCDRIGPRLAYTWLLTLGAIPVMSIGLANSFETFLLFRVLIGVIGASFVITQYHTSRMFAPNCIGTANATTAGWGNLGGGVTQLVMPLVFASFVGAFGVSEAIGWRLAMLLAGILCFATGVAYYFLTQDTPEGNFSDLRASGNMPPANKSSGSFLSAARDSRVWSLALIYACCFGMELTLANIAALYFTDYFQLDLYWAGAAAASFGMMNLFARALGGYISDRFSISWGLKGRVRWLFLVVLCEGLCLMLFSSMTIVWLAIASMLLLGLFVKMSNGATYAVVPFVNRQSLGSVAGIVGAGGNIGAVAAGFLFKGSMSWPTVLMMLGALITIASTAALAVWFSPEVEAEATGKPQPKLADEGLDLAGAPA